MAILFDFVFCPERIGRQRVPRCDLERLSIHVWPAKMRTHHVARAAGVALAYVVGGFFAVALGLLVSAVK